MAVKPRFPTTHVRAELCDWSRSLLGPVICPSRLRGKKGGCFKSSSKFVAKHACLSALCIRAADTLFPTHLSLLVKDAVGAERLLATSDADSGQGLMVKLKD